MNKERPGQGSFLEKKPDVTHDDRLLRTGDEVPGESFPPPPPPPEKTENDNNQEPESPSREELLIELMPPLTRLWKSKRAENMPDFMKENKLAKHGGSRQVDANLDENWEHGETLHDRACLICVFNGLCRLSNWPKFVEKYKGDERNALVKALKGDEPENVRCDEVAEAVVERKRRQ